MNHRRLTAPLLLVLLACTASPLHGQGTNGTFPDPIASRDLDVYARRLELSDQQRLAVDRAHEQYLEEMRALREGELAEFMAEFGDLMRRFLFQPEPRTMRKGLEDLGRLGDRIRVSDERLFDQIQTLLTDEQAVAMGGVRRLRERARYRTGLVRLVSFANPAARVDLSVLVDELSLAPADAEALAPLVDAYEQSLTNACRSLQRESQKMARKLVDEMGQRRGAPGENRDANREAIRAAWQTVREIWAESSEKLADAAADIAALNRRTLQVFETVVAEDVGRALRDEYLARAYTQIQTPMARAIARFDTALALEGLDSSRADGVRSTRAALRVTLDRITTQMMDITEAMRRERMRRRFGGGAQTDHQTRLGALAAKRDEAVALAIASLQAILGPNLTAALDRAEEEATPDADGTSTSTARGGPSGTSSGGRSGGPGRPRFGGVPASGPDRFLPDPIGTAEVAWYRDRLDLSGAPSAILTSLHDSYLERYETFGVEHVEPLREANRRLWSIRDADERITPPTAAQIDAVYALRRTAIAAMRELDAFFLRDIELVVVTGNDDSRAAAMQRLRDARERVVYNRGTAGSGFGGGRRWWSSGNNSREASVDLAAVFEMQEPSAETRAAADAVLASYEGRVATLFRERYELLLRIARQTEQSLAAAVRARHEGLRAARDDAAAEGATQRVREISESIIALNQATLDELVASLGESPAKGIRDGYRRHTYPTVYDDPGAMETHLRSALALDDLTGQQRAHIVDIASDYQATYARLCDALVELETAEGDPDEADWRNQWRRRREQRSTRDRLHFERSELNDRARRRLESVLDDTQRHRVRLDIGRGAGPDGPGDARSDTDRSGTE